MHVCQPLSSLMNPAVKFMFLCVKMDFKVCLHCKNSVVVVADSEVDLSTDECASLQASPSVSLLVQTDQREDSMKEVE